MTCLAVIGWAIIPISMIAFSLYTNSGTKRPPIAWSDYTGGYSQPSEDEDIDYSQPTPASQPEIVTAVVSSQPQAEPKPKPTKQKKTPKHQGTVALGENNDNETPAEDTPDDQPDPENEDEPEEQPDPPVDDETPEDGPIDAPEEPGPVILVN